MSKKLKVVAFKTKEELIEEEFVKMPTKIGVSKSMEISESWFDNHRCPDPRNSKRSRKAKILSRDRRNWDKRLELNDAFERYLIDDASKEDIRLLFKASWK